MYIHPELAATLDRLPDRPANPYVDMPALRAEFRTLMAGFDAAPDDRVDVDVLTIPGPDGNAIESHVVRPRGATGVLPAVVHLHGGGFAYGDLDGPSPMARDACVAAGAVVVNPHYRLAPSIASRPASRTATRSCAGFTTTRRSSASTPAGSRSRARRPGLV
jgi:acetyl esterase